jgi:phosphoglucosamine mutase
MSHKLFGTDGIRGKAGIFPIDADGAYRLGRAVAARLGGPAGEVLLGRDTRPSGAELSAAVADGLAAGGCDVVDLGIVPTPAAAYHLRARGAAAALAISASHNAAPENGFKLFGPGGEKVFEDVEADVERLFWDGAPVGSAPGRQSTLATAAEEYVEFAIGTLPAGQNLRGLKVAVDCGHGATSVTTPAALERLGLTVVTVNADHDGTRINADCGSQHPRAVMALAESSGADLGLAHDGDGDRVVFVDEKRQVVDGDRLIGLTARALAARGELGSRHVVGTVLSNIGLEKWLAGQGLTLHRAAVGDRNVWRQMLALGADIGGEPSGHVIFRRLLPTDDALLTALQVLSVTAEAGRSLAELASAVPMMPQAVRNVWVKSKPKLDGLSPVHESITAAKALLNGDGRLIVRYSGTESLARIMAEGPDTHLLGQVVGLVETAFRVAGLAA